MVTRWMDGLMAGRVNGLLVRWINELYIDLDEWMTEGIIDD